MYFFYSFVLTALGLVSFPFFLAKMIFAGKTYGSLTQKLGFLPAEICAARGEPRIWVHAVSVGEVSAVQPLLRRIRETYPEALLLLSTGTASGQKVARERIGEASGVFYFPLDLPWIVRRVLGRVKPDLFITAETELWPNLLRLAKQGGARTMLANGRISDRSFPRYRRTRFFWTAVLDYLDVCSMIGVHDGERIVAMGANPVTVFVNGNCKFDQAVSSADPMLREEMQRLLGLGPREAVFVAGSTHEGEEEIVLRAFLKMRRRHPGLVLVLVPRHAERAARVEKILAAAGLAEDALRRSAVQTGGMGDKRVLLWDTFGELFKVYSIATLVFCGGSLVPRRGQNILEPAAWGKVVLYGPSMEDFADARRLLESAGAGIPVRNGEEIAAQSLRLLDDPQDLETRGNAGREALAASCGASERNMHLVRRLIQSGRSGAAPRSGHA